MSHSHSFTQIATRFIEAIAIGALSILIWHYKGMLVEHLGSLPLTHQIFSIMSIVVVVMLALIAVISFVIALWESIDIVHTYMIERKVKQLS